MVWSYTWLTFVSGFWSSLGKAFIKQYMYGLNMTSINCIKQTNLIFSVDILALEATVWKWKINSSLSYHLLLHLVVQTLQIWKNEIFQINEKQTQRSCRIIYPRPFFVLLKSLTSLEAANGATKVITLQSHLWCWIRSYLPNISTPRNRPGIENGQPIFGFPSSRNSIATWYRVLVSYQLDWGCSKWQWVNH